MLLASLSTIQIVPDLEENSEQQSKENITFRFSKQILDKLRFEAEHQNVSLNTIAQRVVSEYYDWHINAAKAGMIPIHKSLLALLLDKISDDETKKVGEFFADSKIKEILLVLRSDYSVSSFLDMFESWLTVSSMLYGKEMKNNRYSYVIQHDLGMKWSLFLSTMIQHVFGNMGIEKANFELTENTIMFDVPVKSVSP
jgi:hypothetical protein